MLDLVVFDYDGTLTDLNESSVDFVKSYKEEVRSILSLDSEEFEDLWGKKSTELYTNPGRYGWEINERISVPLFSDPLLETQTIAVELYKKFGLDSESVRKYFFDVYGHNAQFIRNIPAKGLTSFLDSFDELNLPGCIITNSSTESVARKIKGVRHLEDFALFGDAKKFIIDDSVEGVPILEEIADRLVYLRRPNYLNTLNHISSTRGVLPSNMIFVGDVYDFDLALPRALGAHVIYLPWEKVPASEISFLSGLERVSICKNLGEVSQILKDK